MSTKLVVLGGGPGGYVAALRASALGANVTLIEKENLGGTCLNWGCIPSKIMKNTADLFLKFKKAKQFGINCHGEISTDMTALMERKNKILETQRKGIESLLKKSNVAIEYGAGSIKDNNIVQVTDFENNVTDICFDKLIIATGTSPLNVDAFPFDHEKILSSNDLLCLETIPDSIVIVGGGVIGCEFAFILSSLGANVTIIEAMSRLLPLPSVDLACSKSLLREMKKQKISVYCDTVVTSVDISKNGVNINLDLSSFTDNPNPKKPKVQQLESCKIAVCIGREALSSKIGLENIDLQTDERGWINVNSKMETSIDNVYAIGDILGPKKVMLAHVASHEGIIAAQNAMGQESQMNYNTIPGAIFTMPEIGIVGLSESQALKQGLEIETFSVNFRTLGKAQVIDEIAGEAKMIVEKDSKKLLGVHIIGPHATDLIAEATLAVEKGLTAFDIAHTIHAHPTLAEIMGEVSLKAAGIPIHG